MFLHEDKELFKDVIEATAESQSQPIAIVEKRLLCNYDFKTAVRGSTGLRF